MKYKPNAYLVRERSSCYAVKVTLPFYMRSLFGNRTAFMRSTGTADIRERKALGERGTERKVFHSLRGMFISQLDRGGVPEDRIALIVGHERGKTESFRTYSQGASMKELSNHIELAKHDGIGLF